MARIFITGSSDGLGKLTAKSLIDLENGCRRTNTTLSSAGMASWLSLLSTYTGESSVSCGVVLSGRMTEATEHAIFPCINMENCVPNTHPLICPT